LNSKPSGSLTRWEGEQEMKIETPGYFDILSLSEFPGFGGMTLVDLVQGAGAFGILIMICGVAALFAAIVGKVTGVLVAAGGAVLLGVVGSYFGYSRMIEILSSAPSSPDPQAFTNGANSVAFTLSFGVAVAILCVVLLLPQAILGLLLSGRQQHQA